MDNIERIAIALERIADALERNRRAAPSRINATAAHIFVEAMREHRHKLKGRMSIEEIAAAIEMSVTRSDRTAIGEALTQYGARKGKSGSARYYVFD
jgi:hypothetical protein